jgi:tRNA modification GTPase
VWWRGQVTYRDDDAMKPSDTIAAIATAPGRAGIGIVRVSGNNLLALSQALVGKSLVPRCATLCTFRDAKGAPIDQGIAIFFDSPDSFTGEEVLELHGHGGSSVLQLLLRRCLETGARIAHPGEFTRRAFLNEKLDLAQAESVADLIDAASDAAVQSAARSLVGEFSEHVNQLVNALTELRMHVEAGIDFPEEEVGAADREAQLEKLASMRGHLDELLRQARQGAVLREGLTVALIGRPNVGKSSLLNRLAGEDVAIVTPVPGTTRDQVRATITIEGVPIHLIDTAGLRDTDDPVEKIGIERTWQAVEKAGAALLISEAGEAIGSREAQILQRLPARLPAAWVYNKIDLHGQEPAVSRDGRHVTIRISALTGDGVDLLRLWLLEVAGWQPHGEGIFMARERHLLALRDAQERLEVAAVLTGQFDLFAEELRLAQMALASITGEFTPDDLLGEIFSRFCIGK